jgi:cell division protein ZapE
MILLEHYYAAVAQGEICDDPGQRDVIEHMQRLINELQWPQRSWFSPWRKRHIKGIYLHGPVGVGKTYLGDLFYQNVPIKQKARFHFHRFMQQIDAQLRRLQGHKDPLRQIAADLARSTRLIYFDEFMVYDVADAMILAELLQALFAQHVVLVATSNTAPTLLYANGVQRERFLKAIALIQDECEVLALAAHPDYRLGRTPLAKAFLYPLGKESQQILSQQFSALSTDFKQDAELCIQQRMIPFVRCGEHAIWFKFDVICNLPRSSLDYLEIAERFDTVFLSDVPKLGEADTVRVILLIHFIDVMYDRGIRLFISAAVDIAHLYCDGELLSKFQRAQSRLEEMQSEDYLQRRRPNSFSNENDYR